MITILRAMRPPRVRKRGRELSTATCGPRGAPRRGYNRRVAERDDDPPLDWELPAPRGERAPGAAPAPEALSVPQVVAAVKSALAAGFPQPVWVVGETVQVKRHAAGHVFLDLVDHEAGAEGRRATLRL
ncbi:MAG: exodeoxyribonuclease VII large subunit, partial [Planctomycetes bacterium]|nr:exodeoxyribonuclease VII large subunit [Planctomycetota bacterium]